MSKIYVTRYPDRSYASVVLADFVPIREYVKQVDWLMWNPSRRRELSISASIISNKKHLVLVDVFCQRMIELFGAEVLIRDEQGDDWELYQSKGYSEEELFNYEVKLYSDTEQVESEEKRRISIITSYVGLAQRDPQMIPYADFDI